MRGSRHIAAFVFVAFGSACATEGPDEVDLELAGLASRAHTGVEMIEHALGNPDHTSRGLGEGVQVVEDAARALAAFETDDRAAPGQRLQAVLTQARAWDDAARAIEGNGSQPALLQQLLSEKAFPARVAALNSYERALSLACTLGAVAQPAIAEIADGVERYGGEPANCFE